MCLFFPFASSLSSFWGFWNLSPHYTTSLSFSLAFFLSFSFSRFHFFSLFQHFKLVSDSNYYLNRHLSFGKNLKSPSNINIIHLLCTYNINIGTFIKYIFIYIYIYNIIVIYIFIVFIFLYIYIYLRICIYTNTYVRIYIFVYIFVYITWCYSYNFKRDLKCPIYSITPETCS